MLPDVHLCGEVPTRLLHGQLMTKEEVQIGLDHFLKTMLNMDMVNGKLEKLEEENYIMTSKMLSTPPEFQNNLPLT